MKFMSEDIKEEWDRINDLPSRMANKNELKRNVTRETEREIEREMEK